MPAPARILHKQQRNQQTTTRHTAAPNNTALRSSTNQIGMHASRARHHADARQATAEDNERHEAAPHQEHQARWGGGQWLTTKPRPHQHNAWRAEQHTRAPSTRTKTKHSAARRITDRRSPHRQHHTAHRTKRGGGGGKKEKKHATQKATQNKIDIVKAHGTWGGNHESRTPRGAQQK